MCIVEFLMWLLLRDMSSIHTLLVKESIWKNIGLIVQEDGIVSMYVHLYIFAYVCFGAMPHGSQDF